VGTWFAQVELIGTILLAFQRGDVAVRRPAVTPVVTL
jgi:hypothetical protein